MLSLAIVELRASTTRSIALAAVAGLAVYGSVAIGGARDDLLGGIDEAIVQYFHTADVWVVNGEDIFNMSGYQGRRHGDGRSLACRGWRRCASTRGGCWMSATRRLWLRARPAEDPAPIEVSQVVHGNATTATG